MWKEVSIKAEKKETSKRQTRMRRRRADNVEMVKTRKLGAGNLKPKHKCPQK